jgi:glucose 1-dehydrogenase
VSYQRRVAIVTGGSLGIGAACVRRLTQDGFAVTLNYRSHTDAANAIAQEITSRGGVALVCQADVGRVAGVQHLVRKTVETFGRLDLLVNNAGVSKPTPFLELSEDTWEQQLAVDLKGAFFATQAAARQMIAQGGGGVIVNISSVHEDLPMVGNAAYCAAKGGLRMLTRTLAPELAPHRIRIVNVGPGAVTTTINAQTLQDPAKRQALLAEIPLGRIGQSEEIANAVAWLASDQASYVTGTTLFVDGGLMVSAGSL